MNCNYRRALCVIAIVLPAAAFAETLDHRSAGGVAPLHVAPPAGAQDPTYPGQQCSRQYQNLLKLEMEGLKRIQRLARNEGGKLCARIEAADGLDIDKLIDPKVLQQSLDRQQRELLDALGIDISKVNVAKLMHLLGIEPRLDLRRLKQQCRQSQDGLDRFARSELSRLAGEAIRCDERV
jgi:hypothetical protein